MIETDKAGDSRVSGMITEAGDNTGGGYPRICRPKLSDFDTDAATGVPITAMSRFPAKHETILQVVKGRMIIVALDQTTA